jgi:hypothetical protein
MTLGRRSSYPSRTFHSPFSCIIFYASRPNSRFFNASFPYAYAYAGLHAHRPKESSALGHPITVAARDPARARPADGLSALGSSMALDPFGSWLPGERE